MGFRFPHNIGSIQQSIFRGSKSDFLAIIFSGVGLAVILTKFHYAAYIPSPKGLDLVQSRSLRSLALTGQASVDGRVLRRRG